MKLVVFTASENDVFRGLGLALAKRGVKTFYFEKTVLSRDVPRTLRPPLPGEQCLFGDWNDVVPRVRWHLADADAAIVCSDFPDLLAAARLVSGSRAGCRALYDLGPATNLGDSHFDLVLSQTGGAGLEQLRRRHNAARIAPLYPFVDAGLVKSVRPLSAYAGALSHLGNYTVDRHAALVRLVLETAAKEPTRQIVLGGIGYPPSFAWQNNITYVPDVPWRERAVFHVSSRLSLHITPASLARHGFCPSQSLLETAALGAPIISDSWAGLAQFFTPEHEIFVVHDAAGVRSVMQRSDSELLRVGAAAKERALSQHTAARRADELIALLQTRRGEVQRAS